MPLHNTGGFPIGPGAGPGIGLGEAPKISAIDKLLMNPKVKGAAGGIFGYWLLNKLMQGYHEKGMRDIQREGLRSQAEMLTPENLYFQAAQPQAQEEESMARQALFSQLSGGVLGPQLAKGEYQIGG